MTLRHTASELRRAFLEFFRSHNHEVLASGALIPANDPSLMFANAGMVQFKDLFLGRETRPYKRATTSQKVIRISGKHNDLEAVGPSPRHHTFFEMLGNFSFGDYFKEEAIVYAWEFLTRTLAIPPNRLICTYFKGENGIAEDAAARELWRKVTGFGDDRIRGLGASDNFWQMGDTGPCGPCSEIYFYHGENADPQAFGQEQTPEGFGWMEVWNLVFMQFERTVDADGNVHLNPLPAPSIDTGAGLERLAGVVQGKTNNYDTDILRALVQAAAEIAGKPYRGTAEPDDVSLRVIADHARTTAFLIAEGILPDRTGREYVLRRVMRRAIRHGHRLGIREIFLPQIALKVTELMGDQYPELLERRDLITSVAAGEEERFRQTIERGLTLLDMRFAELEQSGSQRLSGSDAFQLYDTFGFPLDLTEVICTERGLSVDIAGYESALEEARRRSEFKGFEKSVEAVYRRAAEAIPGGSVRFTGYEQEREHSSVLALVVAGEWVEQVSEGVEVEVVTASTSFYGESGGQVGDQGLITTPNGGRIQIQDTQKPVAGLVVHQGRVQQGTLKVGEKVELLVDGVRRNRTRRNHSATHLLHWALRQVLGPQAQQKGSLVGPERLRFDFTHNRGLSAEELQRIEDLVNERTLLNHPVRTEVLNMQEARARGAVMIFEEKYGDVVRMLTMGESIELCGGTHARATGEIGLFKIVSEQGVAAGVRRIVAVTGEGALAHLRELEREVARAAALIKATPATLAERLEKLLGRERALEKKVDELERKLLAGDGKGGVESLLRSAEEIAGAMVLAVRTEVVDRAALRELAEQLRDRLGNSVVLLGSESEGKAQFVLTVAKPLTARYKAGELIRGVAQVVGGSGGGRPDMAQAGGPEVQRLDEALAQFLSAMKQSPG